MIESKEIELDIFGKKKNPKLLIFSVKPSSPQNAKLHTNILS